MPEAPVDDSTDARRDAQTSTTLSISTAFTLVPDAARQALAKFVSALEELPPDAPGHLCDADKRRWRRDVLRVALQATYNLAGEMEPQLALPFRQIIIALNEIDQRHEVDWLTPDRKTRPPLTRTITLTRVKIVGVQDFLHDNEKDKKGKKMTLPKAVQFIRKELGPERVRLLVGPYKRRSDIERAMHEWRRKIGRGCSRALRQTHTDIMALLARQPSSPKEAAADVLRVIAMDID